MIRDRVLLRGWPFTERFSKCIVDTRQKVGIPLQTFSDVPYDSLRDFVFPSLPFFPTNTAD